MSFEWSLNSLLLLGKLPRSIHSLRNRHLTQSSCFQTSSRRHMIWRCSFKEIFSPEIFLWVQALQRCAKICSVGYLPTSLNSIEESRYERFFESGSLKQTLLSFGSWTNTMGSILYWLGSEFFCVYYPHNPMGPKGTVYEKEKHQEIQMERMNR